MAKRYTARSGSLKGGVGNSGVIGCSVSGGFIILNYKTGLSRRYDASSGSDRGGF